MQTVLGWTVEGPLRQAGRTTRRSTIMPPCPHHLTNLPCTPPDMRQRCQSVIAHSSQQPAEVADATGVDALTPGPDSSRATTLQDHQGEDWFLEKVLPPQVGPVQLQVIPGRGRGVIATRAIQTGELLICVPPVAILNAPPGQARADGEQLVDQIIDQGLYKHAWFQALYDGTPKSCAACPDLSTPADAPGVEEEAGPAVKGFAGSKARKVAAGKGAGPRASTAVGGLDKKAMRRIATITKLNCYGDNHDDLALCELRGEQARGHLGVWGAFAMCNHSCAPNSINYVVGDSMIVRASRPIEAGEEVSISYLGRPQLWPVQARRAQLQDDYGFECSCDRCTQELQHLDKLDASEYDELHLLAYHRMRGQFEEAVQGGDTEELETLHSQLQASLQSVAQRFRRTLLSPRVRLYLMASLYEVTELMTDVCGALGLNEDRAYQLGNTLKFIQEVTPGSDLHTIVAAQHHAAQVELHGPESDQAQRALVLAQQAHQARYGRVSSHSLGRLIELNRTLYK